MGILTPIIEQPYDDGLNSSDSGKYAEDTRPLSDVEETTSKGASLSDEQLAFYRSRLESGFYRSSVVIKEIVERLSDEMDVADNK